VDASVGVLGDEDRVAQLEAEPALLRLLAGLQARQEPEPKTMDAFFQASRAATPATRPSTTPWRTDGTVVSRRGIATRPSSP
jgi:hypothetical protein